VLVVCFLRVCRQLSCLTTAGSCTQRELNLSRDCNSHKEAAISLDFAAGVADIVELLQGVGMLRVLDVPDVLQMKRVGTC
jgi:hypothetical protein